jgi:hypothetical protein
MAGGELGCDLRQQCASWPGSARDDRRAGRACAAQALTGLPIDRKFGIIRCVVTEN